MGSLRWAVRQATDYSLIQFHPSLAGSTITLDSTLRVGPDVTIEGPPSKGITISGGGTTGVLELGGGAGVARLEGRLGERAGDTLVLGPLTDARTAAGPVQDLGLGSASARVVLGEGVTATATRRELSGTRTLLLTGGLFLAAFAVLWLTRYEDPVTATP